MTGFVSRDRERSPSQDTNLVTTSPVEDAAKHHPPGTLN
jgi:hypothetical protein